MNDNIVKLHTMNGEWPEFSKSAVKGREIGAFLQDTIPDLLSETKNGIIGGVPIQNLFEWTKSAYFFEKLSTDGVILLYNMDSRTQKLRFLR